MIIYSGIAPPQALLDAMQDSTPGSQSAVPPRKTSAGYENAGVTPSSAAPDVGPSGEPLYDDAPPSYEDAIAQDLPPIDGPRSDYAPPPIPEGESGFPEEKGR